MNQSSNIPPVPLNADGKVRRVGVELEMSGLDLATTAEAVRAQFGGTPEAVSDYEIRISDARVGEFRIELDFEYLKTLGRERPPREGITGQVQRLSEEALAEVASLVVPVEIVSPPIEPSQLVDVDQLIAALRQQGGRGTHHSALYAFGLHLNPEVPRSDASTILRYLQAFLCAYEWLLEVENVDWSRRVTPYINPFPREYIMSTLREGYAPDLATLIDHYLLHNAERNRALDMLPLFAHLDADRVRTANSDPRIKARPTFHYRLPNCDVDAPHWGVTTCWQNWLVVERLAEQPEVLTDMCRAYHAHLDSTAARLTRDWAERARQWLPRNGGRA